MKTVTFVPASVAQVISEDDEFREHVVNGTGIGISIRHPDEPTLFALDDGWFTFVFDDVETPVSGLKMFDIKMAQEIIRVVENYGSEYVVVHCTAGMSRSAAVARWIADNMGYVLELHPDGVGTDKHYNRHVYRTMDACIGKDLATYYENLEMEARMMK